MDLDKLPDESAITSAALTGDWAVISNFVSQGGDVNLTDDKPLRGYTLLMTAVEGQSLNACKYLLARGANVQVRSKAGLTALLIAKQVYHRSLPATYEKRIKGAERRLKAAKEEKYREAAKRRLELYKRQYEEADTSEEAQSRARMIVELLEVAVRKAQEEKSTDATSKEE